MFSLLRLVISAAIVFQVAYANTIGKSAKSPGCGIVHNFIGSTQNFSIKSSGGVRNFSVHLPASYKTKHLNPLLIAYHGAGDEPVRMERVTRFSDPSVNPNMVVVYPLGHNV